MGNCEDGMCRRFLKWDLNPQCHRHPPPHPASIRRGRISFPSIAIAALLFVSPALAARTQITDTLFGANGVRFNGTILIRWPSLQTATGATIVQFSQTITVSNGGLSISLEPNDSATPSGTYYTVTLRASDGTQWTENWIVPTSGTALKLTDVRTTPPLPPLSLPASGDLCGNYPNPVVCKLNGTPVSSIVTSVTGTPNQINVSQGFGDVIFAFPLTGVTMPGITTGVFTGSFTGPLNGTASLATQFASSPAPCVTGLPRGVEAHGNSTGCAPVNLGVATDATGITPLANGGTGVNLSGLAPMKCIHSNALGTGFETTADDCGTGSGGGGGNYQTVQTNGSGLTGRATINFSTEFLINDNSGASRTDVSINAVSASKISGILSGGMGGTGTGFVTFAGPNTTVKNFTLPNLDAKILTNAQVVGVFEGGIGVATIPAHSVLIGNGVGAVQAAVPNTAGYCLIDNGSGADPSFQPCTLAGGATQALSNLSSVAINTALLPNSAGTINIGSAGLPFNSIYVGGAATNNNRIVSATTTAARLFTLPNADSNSVIPSSAPSNNFATGVSSGGVVSYAQPAFTNISGTASAGQVPSLDASKITTGQFGASRVVGTATASRCIHTDSSGTNLEVTSGDCGSGAASAAAALDFPSIGDGVCSSDLTFSFVGLAAGAAITPGWPTLPSGVSGIMRASATDTVSVRLCNFSGATVDPASLTYQASYGANGISAASSIDFASIGDGVCSVNTIALTGVTAGTLVAAGWPSALPAGFVGLMRGSAADTVEVRLCNWSGADVDPPALTYRATVI